MLRSKIVVLAVVGFLASVSLLTAAQRQRGRNAAPQGQPAAPSATTPKPAVAAAVAVKSCEGTLELDGVKTTLAYAVVYETKIFDEMGIAVVASDKPIDVNKLKAALAADGNDDHFSLWQPHVKVSFKKTGEVMFTNAWANNFSLSVSGSRLKGDLKIENNQATGTATLDPDDDKKKCDFNFKFNAPLILAPAAPAKAKVADTSDDDDDDEPVISIPEVTKKSGKKNAAPAGPAPNVHELPIPKDATNVQLKELVKFIEFDSKADYKTLAKDLAKKFDDLGWKKDGGDLIGVSAILKRKNGTASLTIFVKPADGGSHVNIMSEGLDWSDPKTK